MKVDIARIFIVEDLEASGGTQFFKGEYVVAATLSGENGSTLYFLEPDWICMELLEMSMLQEQGLLRMY
jgi:hypothetical protein